MVTRKADTEGRHSLQRNSRVFMRRPMKALIIAPMMKANVDDCYYEVRSFFCFFSSVIVTLSVVSASRTPSSHQQLVRMKCVIKSILLVSLRYLHMLETYHSVQINHSLRISCNNYRRFPIKSDRSFRRNFEDGLWLNVVNLIRLILFFLLFASPFYIIIVISCFVSAFSLSFLLLRFFWGFFQNIELRNQRMHCVLSKVPYFQTSIIRHNRKYTRSVR